MTTSYVTIISNGDSSMSMMNPGEEAIFNQAVAEWYDQIYAAVERSLCEGHFQAFMDFHDHLENFCRCMPEAIKEIQEQVSVFFPLLPYKVGKMNWIQFDSWVKYGVGNAVKSECGAWSIYGRMCIKYCNECKLASLYNPLMIVEPCDQVEVPIESVGSMNE